MSSGGDDRQGGGRAGRMQEEESEERTDMWMATYSDMVTLLMTFFVLMFALSNIDQEKFALFAAAMQGVDSVQLGQMIDEMNAKNNPDPTPSVEPITPPETESPSPSPGETDPSETDTLPPGTGPSEELYKMYERITAFISEKGLEENFNLLFSGEYVLMTLANDILFDSAETTINPGMVQHVAFIGQVLAEAHDVNPFEIVVVGHTDNVPIHTPRYPSNWDVSVERAVNILRVLVSESKLDADFFSARGNGEQRPIADNNTAEGRAKNRRVEILITVLRPQSDGVASQG